MASTDDEPEDALEMLASEDDVIRDLYARWDESREKLRDDENVETRWEKGSVGKLLLQHAAVRESAKQAVAGRLREIGDDQLADRIEGDGVARRAAIARCDETIRGRQAIAVNSPDSDEALADLERIIKGELPDELDTLVPAARQALGPAGQRGLPSGRQTRTHAPTHPNPVPKWYDRIGPMKALHAYYTHLRGSPSGGTAPGVDRGREQTLH